MFIVWSLFLPTSQKYCIWIQTPKETNHEIKTSIFTCCFHEIKTFSLVSLILTLYSLWTIFIFSQFHEHIFRSSVRRCSSKYVLLKISQYSDLKRDSNRGAWCKSGTRTPGLGTRDPRKSLKVAPETPLKFKSGTPGPPSKFKSGTLIIKFLHCLTYFVLDKYVYNMDIIFHK